MPMFVVSDVHLGSRFLKADAFRAFLDSLPAGAALVLNGDTLDDPALDLPPAHRALFERLAVESRRRRVVWIEGNHDEDGGRLPAQGRFEIVPHLVVDRTIYIAHGDRLETVMRRHRLFRRGFRLLHGLRVRLGAHPVHVAEYAKRWPFLYNVLRRNQRDNAGACAREHGCSAIVTGHVHFAEDTMTQGIRYLNCGCWTESPNFCVRIEGPRIELVELPADL